MSLDDLAPRLAALLDRLDPLLPGPPLPIDWERTLAARWRREGERGWLEPIAPRLDAGLDDLLHVERQKAALVRNTRQFLAGLPANDALLWGPRGTGKSSLVRAILAAHHPRGLRLVEVVRPCLVDLPLVVAALANAGAHRFIVYCDDLTFEREEPGYRALKSVLDGSLLGHGGVLVYATSNRRHLLPETFADAVGTRNVDGEVHHAEAVEERLSLSERFGLWLAFHPFAQQAYLDVVVAAVARLAPGEDFDAARLEAEALRFALLRGSRSGRVAMQFARDWVGAELLARRGDATD